MLCISICIGLPTFLLGCNKDVINICITYDVFIGNIYDYEYDQRICRSYTCYDAYVLAYDSLQTNYSISLGCKLQTASGVPNENDAKHSTDPYDIEEEVHWYRKKGTKECHTNGEVLQLWYVGVVFLLLAGLSLYNLYCRLVCCKLN